MQLVEIQIEPGIYTEQTDRGAMRRWRDGDHVRFRYGLPEKIGGWAAYEGITLIPPVRAEHDWSSLDNQQWLALASPQKLYLINNGNLYDITPIASSGVLTDPFSTTNGDATVVVSHVDHGLSEAQFVNYTGATAVGGLTIDGSYQVATIIDGSTYTIEAASPATGSATGGGAVTFEYEIAPPIGTEQQLGWGAGPYGQDDDPDYLGAGWSTPRDAINLRPELSLWSLDNWGQDLMACRRGGPIYVWERSGGPNIRARIIPNAPVANNWILVSPEDRILTAYGSHDGNQRDQSLIRWCAREDYNDWTPTESNAAGDKRIDSGSRILSAVRTRNETVIWTDTSIYSQQTVGDPEVFLFSPRGEALSIVGPNAAVEAGGVVYFMARDEFVRYDGTSQILPCTVRDYVFARINRDALEKVYASVNKEQSEVWWFYQSNDEASTDNDSYVIYNYRENTWYYGSTGRTSYTDSGFEDTPIAVDAAGKVYAHEIGYSDDGEPLNSFVESYAMEISDIGDFFGHINRFIPDFQDLSGEVEVSFRARPYPRAAETLKGPYPVDQTTRKIDFRVRGRQISILINDTGTYEPVPEEPDVNSTFWRFGTFRISVTPDGKR